MEKEFLKSIEKYPMSLKYRCKKCHAPRDKKTCFKCGNKTFTPAKEWENPCHADIAKIIKTGKGLGYNITLHGSLMRDLDIVAIPWIDNCASSDKLIQKICKDCELEIIDNNEQEENNGIAFKPHGRIAVSLINHGKWMTYVDLSIMPTLE